MRRFVFIAAALVVAGASPVLAESSADAVRDWVAAIDETPEWSARFATLTDNAETGQAIVTGLAIHSERDGGARFDFNTVTVKGFAANAEGLFAAEEIIVDQGVVTAALVSFVFHDVELTGLVIPASIAGEIDRQQPLIAIAQVYDWFSQLRLDHLRIGRIENTQGTVGETTEVLYEDLELDGLSDGRLELFAAGPARVAAQSSEGQFLTSVQRVEARGVDFEAMARFLDPDRDVAGDDGGWRQVLALATYRGMVVEDQDMKVSVDDVSLEDFRVRTPPPGYGATLKRIISDEGMSESERDALSTELGLDILSSIEVGRMSLRNVEANGPDIDRFRVGGLTIRDISLASIGEISLDDLAAAASEQGSFSLERFAVGGIVLPKLEALRAAARAEEIGTKIDPLSLLPQIAFVELLGAKGLFPDAPPISLDRLRFELLDYVASIPTSASSDLRGLEVPVDAIPDADAKSLLKGLGLQRVNIDYGYRIRWRETDERVIIDDIHLDIEDVGAIKVSLVVSGLTRQMIEAQDDPERMLQNLFFEEARIVFEDRSITDRAIRYLAEQNGSDPEEVRQETADAVPLTLRIAIANDDLRSKLAPALKAFLLKPGRLTLTARAKEPLSLAQLVEVAGIAPESLSDLILIDITQE